jgi:hypothetical protein
MLLLEAVGAYYYWACREVAFWVGSDDALGLIGAVRSTPVLVRLSLVLLRTGSFPYLVLLSVFPILYVPEIGARVLAGVCVFCGGSVSNGVSSISISLCTACSPGFGFYNNYYYKISYVAGWVEWTSIVWGGLLVAAVFAVVSGLTIADILVSNSQIGTNTQTGLFTR